MDVKHGFELLRSYLDDLDLFDPFRIEVYKQTGKPPEKLLKENFESEEKIESIGDLIVALIDFKKSPFWKRIYLDICELEGVKPIWEKI